ncbi:MAG TPA: antibiotic ABC transporter ATP-binding protein [Flavobacteriales bacterium]|nr:ABC transporter ATP-binding protein [Bacteroidota bacterium]HCL47080.1 antibiotic ABC transporter ATP-binding protein [Flavobacteriales bacterium]
MSPMDSSSKAGKIFDVDTVRVILAQVGPYRRRFAWTGAMVILLSSLVWVRPALIRQAVDVHIATGDLEGLLRVFLMVVGVLVVEALVQYRVTYLANWVAQSVSLDLRAKLYRHVSRFRLKYFDQTPVGALVTRHVSDIDGVAGVFSNGILNAVGDLLALFVVIGAMLCIDWSLTLVVLFPIPVLLVATRIFQKHIKGAFVDVRNQVAKINEFVQEHVTGMHIVQAFNRERVEAESFADINRAHREANIRSIWAFSVFFPVVEMLSATSVGLLLWLGIGHVVQGGLTLGVVLQFILYVFMLYRPIRQLADRFNVLQMGIVNADRVFKLLDRDDSIPEPTSPQEPSWQGEIAFENVWFAYIDKEDGTPDWVLRGVSFVVRPGERVAFVGATGAGKSSIVNLISRFYEFQTGRITIDGVDIRDIPVDVLRSRIGVVLQDVFLFSGSLRENVRLHDQDITDDQIWEAIRVVGAERFVERLPEGLDHDVRERGATLSVGQRQLIAFVRAYLSNPHILILDEATSSIDSESEQWIQRATEALTSGRTSLLVAHRLNTVRDADRIVVLHQGELVEQGTHEELVALGNVYHRLFEMQFQALEGEG